jgi:hypothetical protein
MFRAAAILVAATAAAQQPSLDSGYRQMYRLQFDTAHRTFQEWEKLHAEDPMGPVSDAAAYLFSEFDRLHILEAEFFTDNARFLDRADVAPDPAVRRKFDDALERGRRLAERALAKAPGDRVALFAATLRCGLRADYLAMIDKRYVASLKEVKAGRLIAQQLLAADPGFYDAYLAIGVENYLLSQKPAPVRWVLRITGAQTDKEVGIRNLRLTAEKGHYLLPYARLLLAVAALRDHDTAQAKSLLEGLAAEFPENPLYAKELARLR